jgi:crotonobetainyl-CoA:carnitine CoA-transferase CaiB-like acyl-CoA transferase
MGWGSTALHRRRRRAVFIGIVSTGTERFCDEFGLKDLLADERLDDNAKRSPRANGSRPPRGEMLRYPSGAVRTARAGRVPFAPLRRPDQLVDDRI